MLTTLPLIAFAALSPLAPRIAQRFGIEWTLWIGLLALFTGIVIRSFPSVTTLFTGTTLIGLAIAVCNVLLPGLIKKRYSHKVGLMTGVYSTAMVAWAALASGVSIPLAQTFQLGWRDVLACWGGLSIVAALVWLPQLRFRQKSVASGDTDSSVFRLWHSPLAWQVTLFMGLQSLLFYAMIAWLPEILHDRGMSISFAGWMVSLMQFASLPTTFLVPMLADLYQDQRGLVVGIGVVYMIGITGLLMGGSPGWIPFWIIFIGISQGASISLSLAFLGLRAVNMQQSAELSGMAQSVGYLLAAIGPILFGFFRDLTHSWQPSLSGLLVTAVIMLIAGLGAGRHLYVIPDVKSQEKSSA